MDQHPLRTMCGPGRATPRRPLPEDAVHLLLAAAESALVEAVANDTSKRLGVLHGHRCELDLLLVRLAADSGARRGELAALRIDDLCGRILHISCADSAGQLTTPTNLSKRVVSRPKVMLLDTGLAARLINASAAGASIQAQPELGGHLLEGFVAGELRRQLGWAEQKARLASRSRQHPMSAAATPNGSTNSSPRPPIRRGVILHTGPTSAPFGDRIVAAPIDVLWTT